jgi:hypothetical protein
MNNLHCLLFLLLQTSVGLALAKNQDAIDLKAYQWKNRLLLVFAPYEEYSPYQILKEQLKRQTEGIIDRDLLVFHVFEKGESRIGDVLLSREQALSLRRHFSIASGRFTVILIGKDGGQKLREEVMADLAEIFSIIDSMPMRQQEITERPRKR